jgi:zinc/manganese transport system ATP-binding protein
VNVPDEPFSAIDAATETDLMAIIRAWHDQGRTIVTVLHDLDLIRAEFPDTLLLGNGTFVWGATADVLTARTIRRARLLPVVSSAVPVEEAA